MNTREWALLIFTILGQLAAGMILVLMIIRAYSASKVGSEQAAKLTDLPLYAVAPVMVLALIASLFHLGKVLHVIGAVPNLGTSWMSREVVSAVLFAVCLVGFAFLQWRKIGSDSLRTAFGWFSAFIGLVYVLCMGMTYMLPAQPAWNTWTTLADFYVTTLLLGVLGSAVALMINYVRTPKQKTDKPSFLGVLLQRISISAIVLLGFEFILQPLYLAYLSTQGAAAANTLHEIAGTYGTMLVIRLVLVFIGAGILAAYLYRNASVPGKESTLANLVYSAFVLVLLSEAMARFIFYAAHFRIGI